MPDHRRRALATITLVLAILIAGMTVPLSDRGLTHTMLPMVFLLDGSGASMRFSMWVDSGHAILFALAGLTLAYAVLRGCGTRLLLLQTVVYVLFQRWWFGGDSGQALYLKLLFEGGVGGYVTAISLQIVAAATIGFLAAVAIGPKPAPGRLRWPDLMIVLIIGLPLLFLVTILTAQTIGPPTVPLPPPAAILLLGVGLMALRTQRRKKSLVPRAFRLPPPPAQAQSQA